MGDKDQQFPDLDVLPNLEEDTEKEGGDKDMVRNDATAILDRDSISIALAKLNIQMPADVKKPETEPRKNANKPGNGPGLGLPIVIGLLVGLIIAMIVILAT